MTELPLNVDQFRDRALEEVEIVHDRSSFGAASDRWTILLDDADRVLGASPPGSADSVRRIVVVGGETAVDDALRAPQFGAIDPDTAVLVRGDDGLLGVWSPGEMMAAVAAGPNRFSPLAGAVCIDDVEVLCAYVEDGVRCDSPLAVVSLPTAWPPCPNVHHLRPHGFVQ